MRIISKFHDYYDSAMRYGMDHECVYIRNTDVKEFDLPQTKLRLHRNDHDYYVDYSLVMDGSVEQQIVGFCGNIYRLLNATYTIRDPQTYLSSTQSKVFYSIENMNEWLSSSEKIPGSIRTALHQHAHSIQGTPSNHRDFVDKELKALFFKYKTPIFAVTPIRYSNTVHLLINPKLKDFNFFKVKNTFEAYQDIYQYISGVLGVSQRPTVEISDKDMCIKKGFDPKKSFRNPVTFKQLEKQLKGE